MTKVFKLRFFLFGVFILLFISVALRSAPEFAFCETQEFDFNEAVDDQIDSLNTDNADQELKYGLEEMGVDESFKDYVKKVLSGEIAFSFSDLIDVSLKKSISSLTKYLAIFLGIVAVSALSGLLKGFVGGMDKSVINLVGIIIDFAVVSAICGVLFDVLGDLLKVIEGVYSFIMAAYPLLLTVMASSGDVASIAFYSPMLSAFSIIIISFLKKIIFPLLIAIMVFSMVGVASNNIKLKKTTSSLRTLTDTLTGALFGLYLTVLGVGGLSVGTADGTLGKMAKYFLKGYVPVLGVYLTDGLDMLTLTMNAIKNGIGIAACVALLGLILSPVIKIATLSLTFKFAAAVSEPLGAEKTSDLLEDLSKSVGRLNIVLLGLAFSTAMLLVVTISG